MLKTIVITYKNGASINLDVPDLYYENKYPTKTKEKLEQILQKHYSKFVKAINKYEGILKVKKYLPFSDATLSCDDVLSTDIINRNEQIANPSIGGSNAVKVPGVYDKVYLDITDTRLNDFLNKLLDLRILENTDKLLQKINSYLAKTDLEFSMKASKKVALPTTSKNKKGKGKTKSVDKPTKAEVPQAVTEPAETAATVIPEVVIASIPSQVDQIEAK